MGETAKRHRKPVIVMEPVKGGILADIPQKTENLFRTCRPDLSVASWAIRFAASHENVMLVLSGMSDCPKNIAVPKYFSLYNADMRELEAKAWTAQTMLYSHFSKQFGKASSCIECGQCEKICPQHIPIREWPKKVAERFEEAL